MLRSLLGGGRPAAAQAESDASREPATVLVIQDDDYDWEQIFSGCTLADGRKLRVVQTGWRQLLVGPVENYSREVRKRCVCTVREVTVRKEGLAGPRVERNLTVFPDFVLVRNEVYTPSDDHRNKLYGLMYAGVPSLNSLSSIYMFCERPIIQGEINRLHDAHGDAFPVIPQNYFASYREFMYTLPFPAVVKVGASHAGAGKMRIADHHDMEDFRSMLQVTDGKYCLAEPFLDGEYDLRIQWLGGAVRAFKRMTVSGNWKTNTGTSACEEIEVTPTYRRWAELAAGLFGGLDICTVDAVHTTDGKEIILEVNGTSSGLFPDVADADNIIIRDLVLQRMNSLAGGAAAAPPPPGAGQR
eukprot:TRINITY_DN65422_c0_g1_i1.p1 TRINITY_DN65422_c0_g1~~TRINITY_DN65422_c0_g1_i1.p1  ORF type:complete len:385 (+),score=133.98 TRINITY_DN65422_c0_g1_i1:87-1157(+)